MPRDGTGDHLRLVSTGAISESSATLQTARKLRSDVVLRLYRRGSIDAVQRLAAEEIREVWMALARGMFPQSRFGIQLPVETKGKRSFREPFERMSDRQRRLYERRYRLWIAETGRMKIGATRTLAALVHEILIDNRGPRQLDRDWRLRNGSARDHLRDALDLYAAIVASTEKL